MGRGRLGTLACAWVLLAAAGGAPAQDAGFVEDVVAAINSKSIERRKALLHPASLACPRPELFDDVFARQAARTVPAGYRWTTTSIPPRQPLLFADKFDYAIRPSHEGADRLRDLAHAQRHARPVRRARRPSLAASAGLPDR